MLVEVVSGRSFAGQVDARTDPAQLWLRTGGPSISILRPIDWARVRQVVVEGKTVPGSEFAQTVQAHRPDGAGPVTPKPPLRIVMEGEATSREKADVAAGAARPYREDGRVAYLSIDVWAANWDSDVEVDGLVVEITPFSAGGRPVSVRGTLEVTLFAQRHGSGARGPFDRRQRWTQRVSPEDFSPAIGTAQYRLPFAPAGANPEFDLLVARYGAVTAELSVPGQGTFAATAASVRLRPASAVRDSLEQATGARFFSGERTGR